MTNWTEELVIKLTYWWCSGVSAGNIAVRLGNGITRCAVIGKVRRLNLPKRETRIFIPTISGPRKNFPKPKEKPAPLFEPEPIGPLCDFPKRGCRYIAAEIESGEWRMCGHDTDGSWCDFHKTIVFDMKKTTASARKARERQDLRQEIFHADIA